MEASQHLPLRFLILFTDGIPHQRGHYNLIICNSADPYLKYSFIACVYDALISPPLVSCSLEVTPGTPNA